METGVETQRSGAVQMAPKGGSRRDTTAAGRQDSDANVFGGVERTKVHIEDNPPCLLHKLEGVIRATIEVDKMQPGVIAARRSVSQTDSRDKASAVGGREATRNNLGARSRGGGK